MVRNYQYQSSARTVRQRMVYSANVRAARKQHIRRSRKGLKSYWRGKKNGLSVYTPRELMQELYKRGYRGTLEFTEVHKIDISNF